MGRGACGQVQANPAMLIERRECESWLSEIHPEHIDGPWIDGFVLDRHVISSRPIGYAGEHMQFETTRSPLGELVYQLKYRNG